MNQYAYTQKEDNNKINTQSSASAYTIIIRYILQVPVCDSTDGWLLSSLTINDVGH